MVLIALFLCTCAAVYGRDTTKPCGKMTPLKDYFDQVKGYTLLRNLELPENARKMLNLDDYVYADFKGHAAQVNLYIGYYYSPRKAYASHSPTICYPSQGWVLDKAPIKGTLKVGPHSIHYNEITTSYGRRKELVLYWYQARLSTNTQVYKNKISMACNKLAFNDSHHGFVRIAVPFGAHHYEEARQTASDFINSFYPQFEAYLTGS